MKQTFLDLSLEERMNFGDGCSWVPDFIFTASCRHHDFNYSRGGYLLDKFKADYDLCRLMWNDASQPLHYVLTALYWLGVTIPPVSYFKFTYGPYREMEDIILLDQIKKKYK